MRASDPDAAPARARRSPQTQPRIATNPYSRPSENTVRPAANTAGISTGPHARGPATVARFSGAAGSYVTRIGAPTSKPNGPGAWSTNSMSRPSSVRNANTYSVAYPRSRSAPVHDPALRAPALDLYAVPDQAQYPAQPQRRAHGERTEEQAEQQQEGRGAAGQNIHERQSSTGYFTVIESTNASRSFALSEPFTTLIRMANGTSFESTPATTTPVIRVPLAGVCSFPDEVNS